MTINSTQVRSLIEPVWHEISSLWSGVDFSFSDPLLDSAELAERALFPRTPAGEAHSEINEGHYKHCW